jgi:DNA polymerase I
MAKKLFLLDGMALVYRAHFALIARPIFTSKGINTSALYGFTQTLLDILKNQQPTHIAVAFDTDAPTERHAAFKDYKATRQAMPEELSDAIPHVARMLEAFRIPRLTCDGYEADDIIGTLVRRAEKEGFQSYMVTPDKDFGQLVNANTFLYKPSRMGDAVEVMGLPEIQKRWGIQQPERVIDIMALWGDTTDNIPGVPGIGEKTAIKLITEYGSVENLLAHTADLKGKVKESLESHREDALLSKRLVTINCDAPCPIELEDLKVQPWDDERLKSIFVEFEFNSIGKRLFGDNFKAGRGYEARRSLAPPTESGTLKESETLVGRDSVEPSPAADLKNVTKVPHTYRAVTDPKALRELLEKLRNAPSFALAVQATHPDPKHAKLLGIAFALEPHIAYYAPFSPELREVIESDRSEKVGHDLKFDIAVLRWHGISVRGKLFDTMLAHSLIEPDLRHSLDFLSEAFLGYSPIPSSRVFGEDASGQKSMLELAGPDLSEYAAEKVDLALQLRGALEPLLKSKQQERVFYQIEAPLLPVLVEMEYEGIKVDSAALADFSAQLSREMADLETAICRMANKEFNINSPRQLGEVLFDILKICEAPKKTKTGQYATDEQTLMALAPEHEIVQKLLEYRTASKLKSTYADTLPGAMFPRTGRVHTTYQQTATSTGRLNSGNPNLQNIPIRTEKGQEIRKAFVPRASNYVLLSADYSQIELRIIAELSQEPGLLEAFATDVDIHTATAAKVFGVALDGVTAEMRRKAKMVNYGIAYGISAFGLAQRLGIPRKEGGEIIDQYFRQFPGIRNYMDSTIAFARQHGFVETVTGRRRYIRDIRSANHTVRSAAERNAINAPIQGTAADMIKIAMIRIQNDFQARNLKTRMLLQVHDELVFDLHRTEEKDVRPIVEDGMKTAIPMKVPIVVEMGAGPNWLSAH